MILIFGGTTEGRTAVKVLDEAGSPYYYSTRGNAQQIECKHGTRVAGGMDCDAMTEFCELRHLAETRGRYMPSCYVVRLYDWDTDMGRLQEMRGRLDGPACPDDPQQVYQLRERIWKAENRMVREAERILESDPEIPLRQTYIEKLDAELQTLGWFARFPEKIDSPYTNRQLLDKYSIESGIPREDQSRQIEKAFRELDARLVRITGRQPYADDLFESLRQKGPKPEKHISGVRQKEINSAREEQTEQPASGRRIKR